jgi:hypothetical protein
MSFALKKETLRQAITYFSLLCLLFSSLASSSLRADCPMIEDDESERRARTARILVGVTIVALGAGIAYAAFGSTGKCHHHSSSSSSSCSRDSYYSCYSHHDHHHHRHHHDHAHHHHHHHSYSSYSSDLYSRFGTHDTSRVSNDVEFPFAGIHRSKISQDPSVVSNQLSGVFTSQALAKGQGSMTPFIQLPDGMTQVLGSIPLGKTGISIPYGPFDQEGTYTFGIRVEEGAHLPMPAIIGSFEVEVNGSLMQKQEINLPANPPNNYESNPFTFHLS